MYACTDYLRRSIVIQVERYRPIRRARRGRSNCLKRNSPKARGRLREDGDTTRIGLKEVASAIAVPISSPSVGVVRIRPAGDNSNPIAAVIEHKAAGRRSHGQVRREIQPDAVGGVSAALVVRLRPIDLDPCVIPLAVPVYIPHV